ncbi:hypothetical protein CSQ96_18800 [Janthinobacterium sp. BJB412]|jgi:hypothetical protein|nr:hypothetical protein CSQ96_18800 [Janthinobacterium sp. BJB412]
MGAAFWIKRYLLAAVPLFAILALVDYFKGARTADEFTSAAIWAVVAAAVYTISTFMRYRKEGPAALGKQPPAAK